jgi:hypothetical protein
LYVANDPVNKIDPSGNFTVVGAIVNIALVGIIASIAMLPVGKLKFVWLCTRRLDYAVGPNAVLWAIFNLIPFGHCYIKFGDIPRGFYPDDRTKLWTVQDERHIRITGGERTLIIDRICRPDIVTECEYDCLMREMTVGNTGTSTIGSGISNNCCTNLRSVEGRCKERCQSSRRSS